jgi:hypothetical protein
MKPPERLTRRAAGGISPIADLDRRLSRAIEQGRGIRLNVADLDLLSVTGAYGVLHQAADSELKERAQCRDVQRRKAFISADRIGSGGMSDPMEPAGAPISPSTGMMPSEDASEARRRARASLNPRN